MKKILCQNCRQKPMDVSYTHILNGHREDYVLCNSCANKLHMQERFSQFLNSSIFNEMMEALPEMLKEKFTQDVKQMAKNSESIQRQTGTKAYSKIPEPAKPADEMSINTSKVLALTMDKEAAIAREDFMEAARIHKIIVNISRKSGV